jgi:hypothetical protein
MVWSNPKEGTKIVNSAARPKETGKDSFI